MLSVDLGDGVSGPIDVLQIAGTEFISHRLFIVNIYFVDNSAFFQEINIPAVISGNLIFIFQKRFK